MKRNFTGLDPFDSNFDSLVDRFFNRSLQENNGASTNIKEYDDRYEVDVKVPGYSKDDININFYKGKLTISASIEEDNKDEENGNIWRREFKKSSFERSFILPENLDENDINAKMENGILNISIKKSEDTKISKKIEIK